MSATAAAMAAAKAAELLKNKNVLIGIGCVFALISTIFITIVSSFGVILSAVFALLNPALLGNIEDDLHYQAIQEVKAELEIENDLNVYTLKVIDLLHHHDFMTDKAEIRQYIKDYFVLLIEQEEEEQPDEDEPQTDAEPVPGETDTEPPPKYRFLLPDEIMEMLALPPFNFGAEELEAIRQMVYMPPVAEDVVFKGKYPMPINGYISSTFGYRTDPISGKQSYHSGIDIAGEWHGALIAIADGEVVSVSNSSAIYGTTLIIKHTDEDGKVFYTFYAHCASVIVAKGSKVKQCDVVGYEGGSPTKDTNPGRSTGPHLHFEIRKYASGGEVNPLDYLMG